MTTKDEALALALEALEKLAEHGAYSLSIAEPAITAIKQLQEPKCDPTQTECQRCKNDISKCDGAFAAPKQAEPIGEVRWAGGVPGSIKEAVFYGGVAPPVGTKLYATQPEVKD